MDFGRRVDPAIFFANHPDPMWLFDRESLQCIEVNDAALQWLGYTRDEFLGLTMADFAPAEDVPRLLHALGQLDTGFHGAGTWPLLRKSGEVVHADIRWSATGFDDRVAVLAAVRDVSRLVSLETERETLLEQQAHLRAAQRLLGLGTWQLDMSTGTLTWSDNVYDIYGVAKEAFGNDFDAYMALVHPQDRPAMLARYQAFIEADESVFTFDHRVVAADGRVVFVRGVGEFSESPGGRVLGGVVQDITDLVETDLRLAEANLLLRLAGKIAHLGGWRVTLEPLNVIWTAETAAIHGETEGFSPTLDQAIAYYVPQHREKVRRAFDLCTRQGKPFDEILQLDSADGRSPWVRAIGEAVRSEQGSIVAVQGAFQDVTELVEARDRTEQLSGRLLETLENMGDGFLTLDRQWRFVFMNSQAERLLDRPRADVLGRVAWDEFPEAVGSIFQKQYEHAMQSGETVRFVEYFPPLEKWFEVSAFPAPDSLGVYFRDVTDRQLAEQAIRLSDERFRIVAKATTDVIWDWDLRKQTVWWNEGMKTRFGYDPQALPPGPESWLERVHPDDRERVLAGIDAAIDGTQTNWSDEYRFLHADGRALTVTDRGYVMRDDEGHAVRMTGSMNDVTERRELDDRLRQSQKLEAIGQITGGVAHDFNNLLTVILGNADLLADQLTDQPLLRQMAEMTATAAERGAELTARLLAFARRQALDPRPVDVNRLIRGMDGMLRRTLTETIIIEIVQADSLWVTNVDPGQLEVALLNLAINARDAMPGGGHLTIETANTRLDGSYARTYDDVTPGQYVMVSVSDTGTGMPTAVIGRAFEPFFTTKEVGKGSGLGLSMVYGFVKQSGGHVTIYTEAGEGTTVKLYFPRDAGDASQPEHGDDLLMVTGGRERILVVEDDALVREHLMSQLEELGYTVSGAGSGPEALEVLQRGERFDLLFTDVVMPGGMNGRQLADEALKVDPAMRILFTSGYSERAIVHHGRLDPGVQLLGKPYRRQELALKVREVLDTSRRGVAVRRPRR